MKMNVCVSLDMDLYLASKQEKINLSSTLNEFLRVYLKQDKKEEQLHQDKRIEILQKQTELVNLRIEQEKRDKALKSGKLVVIPQGSDE